MESFSTFIVLVTIHSGVIPKFVLLKAHPYLTQLGTEFGKKYKFLLCSQSVDPSFNGGARNISFQNIAKQDPGMVRQKS